MINFMDWKENQIRGTREILKVAANWTSMLGGHVCIEDYQTGWVRLGWAEFWSSKVGLIWAELGCVKVDRLS